MNLMSNTRRQLSLYVPTHLAAAIEDVRERVDPVQTALIPAHVTLCREDELLLDFTAIERRLKSVPYAAPALTFGRPIKFSSHGILLPCVDGESQFRSLREYILGSQNAKELLPHMTLAHPRNPKSCGKSLEHALCLPETIHLVFPTIHLIEQEDARPWQVLNAFALTA